MKLARMIAMQLVLAFQRLGIKVPPETMSEISAGDNAILSALRAQTGVQPRASRLPPLIPTYGARVALTSLLSDLLQVEVNPQTTLQHSCCHCQRSYGVAKGTQVASTFASDASSDVFATGGLGVWSASYAR